MKNKLLILTIAICLFIMPTFAKTDKLSAAYLQEKHHFSLLNPIAECIAQKIIKRELKKATGANFKVKLDGYTYTSLKNGIFKNLEVTGKQITIDEVYVPYIKLKTVSEYNWIDYTQNPPIIKSDMTMAYNIRLSEKSLNCALLDDEYQKIIRKVNKIAYPLFTIEKVTTKIQNNKVLISMEYNLPLRPSKRNRILVVSSDFKVVNGKIMATDVGVDSIFGNLQLNKVTHLINLLDPLSYTLTLMENTKCKGKIENVKIVDDIIQIDGKIFIKGQ